MANALKANDVKVGNISFSAPKTLDNGGRMVFVNYNDSKFYLASGADAKKQLKLLLKIFLQIVF